jgi:hypothetical protein
MELHVIVEALEWIAPVGHDAIEPSVLHGRHDVIDLQHHRLATDVVEGRTDRVVGDAQPQALEVR